MTRRKEREAKREGKKREKVRGEKRNPSGVTITVVVNHTKM